MPQLIDIEFAALHSSIHMAMGGAQIELTDFMLLADTDASEQEMSDESIQLACEGISGGVRYEQPDCGS